MLRTPELPVGLIEHANCFVEGSACNTSAVFLRPCNVWALLLYQDVSLSTREGVFTLQAVGGLRSCAATEYKLRTNSVQIKISCIRTPGKDRSLGVFKTCCDG